MKTNERIRMLMENKHLNQKELARLAGITEASMSKYLSGERTPRIDIIVNLANALEVTVDELIGNNIENSPLNYERMKTVLARGIDTLSKEEKTNLLNFY